MIEIGLVKQVDPESAMILVEFKQLDTEANCSVLTPVAGDNNVFHLPPVGAQVVCWLEGAKNIALGCVFSEVDPAPEGVDENTEVRQFGKTKTTATADRYTIEQDKVSFELSGNKASLKNDSTDLKTILNDLLNAIKTLTVATAVGPSGTPLPPTIQAVAQLEQKVNNLLSN